MLPCHERLVIKTANGLTFEAKTHKSIMITVSSSVFRVTVLLHVPHLIKQKNSLTPYLNFGENQDIDRQYADYISELSNNLSGISARMIRTAGYSTGLSQPAILDRSYGDKEITASNPDYIIHIPCYMDGELTIATSYCLFINKNFNDKLDLELKELEQCVDSSGDLEFF